LNRYEFRGKYCKECSYKKAQSNRDWNPFKHLYTKYQGAASKRGYRFELTNEEFINLINSPCFYCNTPNSNTYKNGDKILNYNGIDRINNEIGYIQSNVVACCSICNRMKMDMNVNDFLDHINKIKNNIYAGIIL
jgi:hypothetical protein